MYTNGETNHGIGVRQQVPELVQESLVLHQLSVDVMELGHTHSCGLSYIRILILQTVPQWLTQIINDLVHPNTTHRPDSQGSNKWIRIFTILIKTVQKNYFIWWIWYFHIFFFSNNSMQYVNKLNCFRNKCTVKHGYSERAYDELTLTAK